MNNILMRKVDVTADYQPLAAERTVVTVTISCPPANAAVVYFKGDDGSDGDAGKRGLVYMRNHYAARGGQVRRLNGQPLRPRVLTASGAGVWVLAFQSAIRTPQSATLFPPSPACPPLAGPSVPRL